jgi:hypothetical protein
MSPQGQRLFDLLPALYRLKDAQLSLLSPGESAELRTLQNTPLTPAQQQRFNQLLAMSRGPLQSLLMLIEEQLAVIAEDLDQLYDDQFIETCASWVIPYIGDLIGYKPVHGVAAAVASPRAEVAHTISFRRRKGTVLVLEQLARDVTGWGAHAIEFFKLLAVAQYMKHIRPHSYSEPDLRRWQTREYMDTGFDAVAHNVDVRRIASGRGRYNIQNVGIFLWSLNAYTLTKVTATAVDATGQFLRFSPLGADTPLFNNPVSQGSDITVAARPVNVPDRLRRRVLCSDIQSGAGAVYYGEGNSLALYLNNTLLNPYQVRVCDLSGADGSWANVPVTGSAYAASVDPELGRIALPAPSASSAKPSVQASFCFGFNGDMGGGEYPRSDSFTIQAETPALPFPDTVSPPRYSTLQDALNFAASNLGAGLQAAVEIAGSDVYLPGRIYGLNTSTLQINVPAGGAIELRAADESRPTLILNSEMTVTGGAKSSFNLNGLLITYAPATAGAAVPIALVHVPNVSTNQLGQLGLSHCTLVPGLALTPQGNPQSAAQPALVAELPGLQVVVQKSILGGMRVQQLAAASLSDSIVDACSPAGVAYANLDGASGGGSLTLQGCTVVGKTHATLFASISDSIVWAGLATGDIWTAPLWADRKQQGCVRFSYMPPGSVGPRQFECVQQAEGVSQPIFYSLRYGDPGYGKLLASTGDSIRRGADDGGEMGAFHFVLAPLRETDLRVRLQEYLPVGLELGIFYQN